MSSTLNDRYRGIASGAAHTAESRMRAEVRAKAELTAGSQAVSEAHQAIEKACETQQAAIEDAGEQVEEALRTGGLGRLTTTSDAVAAPEGPGAANVAWLGALKLEACATSGEIQAATNRYRLVRQATLYVRR